MWLSRVLCLRRIINSSYHPFAVIPKPSVWRKREALRRFTAWSYASDRTTVKGSYKKLNKISIYLNMQREDGNKLEKYYGEQRVTAGLAEHHFNYRDFRAMLDKAHILLDNIVLSQLAIYEPKTFKSIVMLTKQMAHEDHRKVIDDDEQKYVETSPELFGECYKKAKIYPRGASENHTTRPRHLKLNEY
uniref:28S ribosomal protein S9, mitochondrial n=1 Tax=Syphacia muris TaxID=451379 RepID=A0A0N5AAG4_9BILA